jgi:hypothetical protein
MVKQGVIVTVNGKQSTVETSWGQGVHRVFKLADGREIFDLDKLVAQGKATVQSIPESKIELPMPPVREPKK